MVFLEISISVAVLRLKPVFKAGYTFNFYTF
jgi:hypothetical protein